MELEKPIEENIIWKLLLECCKSIKYLHEHKIIHRNICLENFYMTDDKSESAGGFRGLLQMQGLGGNLKDDKDEFEFSKGKGNFNNLNNNNNNMNQKTESGKISEEIESDGPF